MPRHKITIGTTYTVDVKYIDPGRSEVYLQHQGRPIQIGELFEKPGLQLPGGRQVFGMAVAPGPSKDFRVLASPEFIGSRRSHWNEMLKRLLCYWHTHFAVRLNIKEDVL